MGTRGTAIIIEKNETSFGPEFKRDMGPAEFGNFEGYGEKFFNELKNVNNNIDFIKFNNKFNKKYFGTKNIMSRYQGKYKNKDLIKNDKFSVELMQDKNGPWITSDWMYIKNATNEKIAMKTIDDEIEIAPNSTIKLYYGEYSFKF